MEDEDFKRMNADLMACKEDLYNCKEREKRAMAELERGKKASAALERDLRKANGVWGVFWVNTFPDTISRSKDKSSIQKLVTENTQLRRNLAKFEEQAHEQNEALQTSMREMNAQNEELHKEILQLRSESSGAVEGDQIEELRLVRREKEELESRLANVADVDLAYKAKALESQVAALKAAVVRAQEECDEAKRAAEESTSGMQQVMSRLGEKDQAIAKLTDELHSKTEASAKVTRSLKLEMERLQTSEAKALESSELDEQRLIQITSLKDAARSLQADKDTLLAKVEELEGAESKTSALQSRVSVLTEEASIRKRDHEMTIGMFEATQAALKEAREQSVRWQGKYDGAVASGEQALTAERDRHAVELDGVRERLALSDVRLREMRATVEELKQRADKADKLAQSAAANATEFEEQREAVKAEMAQVEQALKDALHNLESQKKAEEELKEKHEGDMKEAHGRIDEAHDTVREREQTIENLEIRIADLEEERKVGGKKAQFMVQTLRTQLAAERQKNARTDDASAGFVDSEAVAQLKHDLEAMGTRLGQTQEEKWVLEAKVNHLQDSVAAYIEDIEKKARLVRFYVSKYEKGGARSTPDMDRQHLERESRRSKASGGMLGAFMGAVVGDEQVNTKLQAVMEDTLLKNMQLVEDLKTMGAEVERLHKERL